MARGLGGSTTRGWKKLKGTPAHSKAMLRNLVSSLLEHERVETTLPRAREAQRMAERMITLGKKGTLLHRRKALAFVRTETLVHKVFNDLATVSYESRNPICPSLPPAT
jgi:large subunit ribosomal protein L17|eukprot:COSAG01_NODE_3129_length_6538_cov_5.398354_3_plen_109_part_00